MAGRAKAKEERNGIVKNASVCKNLYAFDFDHTIVKDNSDTFIVKIIKSPLSPKVKASFDGTNWTEYMDKVMKFLATQGKTVDEIQKHIEKLELVPGMKGLLSRIIEARAEDQSSKLVIISDANDVFIKTLLNKLEPPVLPDLVVTNLTQISTPNANNSDSENAEIPYLKVIPYEDQKECRICPKNLCKGAALLKYMEQEGPFDKIFYTGDGRNDICPGLKLRENDVLFVRRGFALEKCIKAGKVYDTSFKILAKIVYFEDGSEIQEEMFK